MTATTLRSPLSEGKSARACFRTAPMRDPSGCSSGSDEQEPRPSNQSRAATGRDPWAKRWQEAVRELTHQTARDGRVENGLMASRCCGDRPSLGEMHERRAPCSSIIGARATMIAAILLWVVAL